MLLTCYGLSALQRNVQWGGIRLYHQRCQDAATASSVRAGLVQVSLASALLPVCERLHLAVQQTQESYCKTTDTRLQAFHVCTALAQGARSALHTAVHTPHALFVYVLYDESKM